MTQRPMKRLRACLYFAWILVPLAVVIGLIVDTVAAHGAPDGGLRMGVAAGLGFLFFPTLGFLLTTSILPPLRSPTFLARERLFPTLCAVLFCLLTLAGVVENTTDLVGRRLGHAHDSWMISVSASLYSIVATVMMAGADRALAWLARPGEAAG